MGLFELGRILQQYGHGNAIQPSANVVQDFDQVAQNSPHEDLANGLSHAFRSEETPPFGRMVSQLFSQGDANQRTGMLNQLLGGLGSGGLGSFVQNALGTGSVGGILSRLAGQEKPQVTPDEAAQFTPEHVEQLASHAEQSDPGIIDKMGQFYAQNPNLVKGLGGAVLAIALGKMAQHR